MAARKSHSIVSNLQTLLHHESEAPGPHYLSKKLETVLVCLPTVPMLRGVALEVLSSCFKYLSQFKGHEQASKPPLSSLVHSTCEVLYSLLTHSPSGWSHTLLQWGVVNLARLSVLYNVDMLPKEGVVNFMMSQESVPFLVKFVEEGIRYKHSNGETDIINLFINISQKENANIGWLLSYIIMENSSLFSEGSLMDGCVLTTPLSPSILSTLSSCFDRLSRTHPFIVSHTLLSMIKRVLDEGTPTKNNPVGVARGGASSVYLQVVLEMMLRSHSILDLVITDVIKLITPEVILSLVCSELERGTNEEKEEGEEEMETDQDSPVLSSLSSLLLQLSHDRAVVAINLLLSSLNYYSSTSGDKVGGAEEEEEEEEEDGEINTLSLAKGQLLEAVKQLLNSVLSVCKKGVSFLLFSSNDEEASPSNKKPVNTFSPIQYIISIQSGLTGWVELVINSPDNQWLIQLVESVGMTSSEISGANILNTLLYSNNNNNKLSGLVDHLFKRYRLRHPNIAQSLITQGVTTSLMKDNSNRTMEEWSINLLTLARNNESCFQSALLSSFNSLLLLLPLSPPLSSIHILSLLETVSTRMARESQLSTSLSAAGILINYYLKSLGDLSTAIMNDVPILYEYEQLLNKIRLLLSHLSSGNSLVEVFICSNILRTITNGSQIKLGPCPPVGVASSLLTINNNMKLVVSGNLLNTRQSQHSESLYRQTMKNLIVEDKVTIASIVSMHCSDHIIMLISDIISKSTLTLASCLTDTVSPHSPSPLKNWPEMNFKSDQRHTLEFHLKIKSRMNENPVMWKILILISNNRSGFIKCSSLIYSLLFVLILNWRKGRSAPSISYNEDLLSTTQLIQSLATAKWLVKPLCYVSELFSELSCEDIARLLEICNSFIYSNYQDILKGKIPTEDSLPDSSWSTLKAILRQNINKFGNIYYRFVSREHITTN